MVLRSSGGWAYPPRDYQRWSDLCFEFTRHLVQRYGEAEVRRWWFETWNEANLAVYWKGTPEEFYKLHDFAIAGVRRALPAARVGGPDVAGHGGAFMEGFLDHVTTGTNYATGATGTPTDFLSFHAKGAPVFVDGHVRMGIREQLATIDQGFRMIAARPALRGKPIVIGESDPDGCAACQGPRLDIAMARCIRATRPRASRANTSWPRAIDVNLQGALTWAFEFEDQPYFAGFRQLASDGIDLPVLNVFRMFSLMHGRSVPATQLRAGALDDILASGVRRRPDVGVMATRSDDSSSQCSSGTTTTTMCRGPRRMIELSSSGLPRDFARVTHYRIDGEHSNAYCRVAAHGIAFAPGPGRLRRAARRRRSSARCKMSPTSRTALAANGDCSFPPATAGSLVDRDFSRPLSTSCRVSL